MVLCFKDEKGWERPPSSVDARDQRHPLAIARLDSKWLNAPLGRSDNFHRPSNTHLKACLVEVVGIFVQNTVLSFDVAHKVELGADNLRIAAEDPLAIAQAGYLRFDVRSPAYQPVYPVDANHTSIAYGKQLVGHILSVLKRRIRSSRVKLSYLVHKRLLF